VAAYRVEIATRARRDLERLAPSVLERVHPILTALGGDPRPVGSQKLVGLEAYRIRVGDHRIIYEIDEAEAEVVREIFRRYAEEGVVRTGVGAGNDGPRGAVPVFGERLLVGVSHGPDIVGGDAGHPFEFVFRPGTWAGDDAPGGSLRHRWGQEQGEQHRCDHARKELGL